MNRIIKYSLLILLLGCSDKGPNTDTILNEVTNHYNLKIGDSWLYKRWFINPGISNIIDAPDTLHAYSYFEITRDTVINGFDFFILEGVEYDIGRDAITERDTRLAVNSSESGLYVVEFKGKSTGYIISPFKRASDKKDPPDYFDGFAFRDSLLNNTVMLFDFDTVNFHDQYTPIIFPLVQNSTWHYREEGHPYNTSLLYTYLGKEKIQIELGEFDTYKFKWDPPFDNSIIPYQWVGETGVLKIFIDFGEIMHTNPGDGSTVMIPSYELFEFYGSENIDPDTLTPWGKI